MDLWRGLGVLFNPSNSFPAPNPFLIQLSLSITRTQAQSVGVGFCQLILADVLLNLRLVSICLEEHNRGRFFRVQVGRVVWIQAKDRCFWSGAINLQLLLNWRGDRHCIWPKLWLLKISRPYQQSQHLWGHLCPSKPSVNHMPWPLASNLFGSFCLVWWSLWMSNQSIS